ncbi:MAG: RdgB/HAM1 family non-canonical purine NTP pyrophosphatase [Blastocatellia bacterium]|nr:RdgB/HAM1 family non-canonical purine NTP pyrophosphatase [Blastocatellia bacterium]
MRDLLIATSNKDKIAEIYEILAGLDLHLLSLDDLPQYPPPVEETANTFLENAVIKAEYYQTKTGLISLADDSGLEVDALGGRPGVYSARYGGEGKTSAQRIALLLEELKESEKRTARFVCCVAIAGLGRTETFTGRCEGLIASSPSGARGFGYDPIFFDPQLGRTFAELSREEKAARSHRGKALREVRKFLIDN